MMKAMTMGLQVMFLAAFTGLAVAAEDGVARRPVDSAVQRQGSFRLDAEDQGL